MTSAARVLIASVYRVVFVLSANPSAYAQEGRLHLHVTPPHAYIFVDGRAISEASKSHSLKLSAGEHKIELVNLWIHSREPESYDYCRTNHRR